MRFEIKQKTWDVRYKLYSFNWKRIEKPRKLVMKLPVFFFGFFQDQEVTDSDEVQYDDDDDDEGEDNEDGV